MVTRLRMALLLLTIASCCSAQHSGPDCVKDELDAHVNRQFAIYGPLSDKYEYFGFIYLRAGELGSAVVRSRECPNPHECSVHTGKAAALLPLGVKVLGEWHTHPRHASAVLSAEDVLGAHANRHLRCYSAYYGQPDGGIYAWDVAETTVPTAMASRTLIGNYRDPRASAERFVQRWRRGREPDGLLGAHVEAILEPDPELPR